MNTLIRVGDLVRIGKNRCVYRVAVYQYGKYYLEADALHPDAAKRQGDAFRWFDADELTLVPRQEGQ